MRCVLRPQRGLLLRASGAPGLLLRASGAPGLLRRSQHSRRPALPGLPARPGPRHLAALWACLRVNACCAVRCFPCPPRGDVANEWHGMWAQHMFAPSAWAPFALSPARLVPPACPARLSQPAAAGSAPNASAGQQALHLRACLPRARRPRPRPGPSPWCAQSPGRAPLSPSDCQGCAGVCAVTGPLAACCLQQQHTSSRRPRC